MPSLLRRWLQKCHRITNQSHRSTDYNNGKERREPDGIPTKYRCEELANEYANYWRKIQEDREELEEVQRHALIRWRAFRPDMGISTAKYPLPLDFFVEIFDDYFFLGALRQYIKVRLADETPTNSAWVGLTTCKTQGLRSGPPEIQIELKRPPVQPLTRVLIQDLFETLLHEMCHAFLMIYSTPAGFSRLRGHRRIVETEGLTGHGPCWVKVAAAVAAEADRSLGELWDRWELKIAESCQLEREALGEPWVW